MRVAMTVAVDLGPGVGLAGKRVVGRDGAVIVQANDFAGMVVEFLGARPVAAIAAADIEVAVRVKGETGAEMTAAESLPIAEETPVISVVPGTWRREID